jgi:hypothetical protein
MPIGAKRRIGKSRKTSDNLFMGFLVDLREKYLKKNRICQGTQVINRALDIIKII